VCGLSDFDTVRISSSRTTHVLLDVNAFWVGTPGQVNPDIASTAAAAGASRSRTAVRPAPSWVKAGVSRRI
jgi:hypothetical protein